MVRQHLGNAESCTGPGCVPDSPRGPDSARPARLPVNGGVDSARENRPGPARSGILSTFIDSPGGRRWITLVPRQSTAEAIGMGRSYFHLHLVSDSTGETLINVGRAAAAQYEGVSAIEHVYPLVRSAAQLDRVISEIRAAPGLVLYTLVGGDLGERLEEVARETGSPCLSVLRPVHDLLRAYLGAETTARPGAQHMLNAEYFKRIDAMNFTLAHDDGNLPDDLEEADVILLGVSRTSKTQTSI